MKAVYRSVALLTLLLSSTFVQANEKLSQSLMLFEADIFHVSNTFHMLTVFAGGRGVVDKHTQSLEDLQTSLANLELSLSGSAPELLGAYKAYLGALDSREIEAIGGLSHTTLYDFDAAEIDLLNQVASVRKQFALQGDSPKEKLMSSAVLMQKLASRYLRITTYNSGVVNSPVDSEGMMLDDYAALVSSALSEHWLLVQAHAELKGSFEKAERKWGFIDEKVTIDTRDVLPLMISKFSLSIAKEFISMAETLKTSPQGSSLKSMGSGMEVAEHHD